MMTNPCNGFYILGNVLLDYTLLSFSYCGTYLASYSSLLEFELALW